MIQLRKNIKNLIIIAIVMPLVLVGIVIWRYGTAHLDSVLSAYIITVGTVIGASRKIYKVLQSITSDQESLSEDNRIVDRKQKNA